jgi:hypothetical protein
MSAFWEKRSARRIPISVDCLVTIQMPDGSTQNGVIKDLSVDGISIETSQLIDGGSQLDISVIPPEGSPIEPLRANIEVIRCTPEDYGAKYIVAASIKSVVV